MRLYVQHEIKYNSSLMHHSFDHICTINCKHNNGNTCVSHDYAENNGWFKYLCLEWRPKVEL